MNIAKISRNTLGIVALLTLAACGGGGGGGGGSGGGYTSNPQSNADNTDPVITLIGDAEITHTQGAPYNDAGANATDDVDGALDAVPSGTVNINEPGQYIITYSATDKAGNNATATRTVTVSASASTDLVVFNTGAVDALWDEGTGAYDAGIDYGTCKNDNGSGCPNISWSMAADADRGEVLQITHSAAGKDVGFFIQSSEANTVDASAYAGGNIVFDILVVSGNSNFSMKIDCVYPCTSGTYSLGSKGASGWETVTVPINNLVGGGLDLSKVNTGIVIWASQLTSTVFQLDNIRWEMGDGSTDGGTDTGPAVDYTSPTSYDGYNLVWSDEFNGSSVNTDNWTHEIGDGCNVNLCGWGNNELEYYRSENTSVANGLLTITAKQESFGGRSYTSSRLKTEGKKFFTYGRIDIRAKLPKGQGIWPALWMLGENISEVSWPASGEIDIMEMVGGSGGESTVVGTAHWNNGGTGASYSPASFGDTLTLTGGETLANKYHVFSLIWNADSLTWYIDDVEYHRMAIDNSVSLSAFQKEFFLLFNVAVGGNWPGVPNANTSFPQRMLVDYVRVFQAD
jgi:beta-glucanase (GH16 family)